MRLGYIPAPYSIHSGISKLQAGWLVEFSHAAGSRSIEIRSRDRYWSFSDTIRQARGSPFVGSEAEAIAALDSQLRVAVRRQLSADVPVGAFLSGGIDSSAVVAVMQAESSRPVRSFSIGFFESGYDEASNARAVASHLGTEHSELYLAPESALTVIDKLTFLYDEPFADSSQIPTFLVSEFARTHVKVSLSGDAGDEIFGGYNRHSYLPKIWRTINGFPLGLRRSLQSVIDLISPELATSLSKQLWPFLPRSHRILQFGDKLHKLSTIMMAASPEEMYRQLVSQWDTPTDVVLNGSEPSDILILADDCLGAAHLSERFMALDTTTYLPGDVLQKVDRASMGVGLEVRLPFLDHELVRFAWSLPVNMKIRDGEGKWILRKVLERYVPRELFNRPKAGFAVPIDAWLRGPLRAWAEDLLDESRMSQEGFFSARPIRKRWEEHLKGRRNWQHSLWTVLMFQAWLRQNKSHKYQTPT
jgi:asparagine synthase (glutamine-hydrolysing)